MSFFNLVFQGEDVASSFTFIHYLIGIILIIVCFAAGYYVSRFLTGLRFRKEQKADRKRMFDIEKALKDFWENERAKLSGENEKLSRKIVVLERQVEEYRKKAAGIGLMGLKKDKRADMLIQMMLENEALEEKLYDINLKMKQERDEFLEKQIKDISYKRILLSEILKQEGVQDKIREVLNEDSGLKKLRLPSATIEEPEIERPASPETESGPEEKS